MSLTRLHSDVRTPDLELLASPSPIEATTYLHPPAPEVAQAISEALMRSMGSGSIQGVHYAVLNALARVSVPPVAVLDELDVAILTLRREWDAALLDEEWETAHRMRTRVHELEASKAHAITAVVDLP
jgi:hypothetical protein